MKKKAIRTTSEGLRRYIEHVAMDRIRPTWIALNHENCGWVAEDSQLTLSPRDSVYPQSGTKS